MASRLAGAWRWWRRRLHPSLSGATDPRTTFRSEHYLRHNARRLEHLASLRVPVGGMSVLEVGAGIGDHSHYYLDRGCRVTITDARSENLGYLRGRFPSGDVRFLNLDDPSLEGGPYDLVHCYGLLYHLINPEGALEFLSLQTRRVLLLETCVSFGAEDAIHFIEEESDRPSRAISGASCRPTRRWLFSRLQRLYEHVYIPRTQPRHEEFPLDWNPPHRHRAQLQRAIFVASRQQMENPLLSPDLLDRQLEQE